MRVKFYQGRRMNSNRKQPRSHRPTDFPKSATFLSCTGLFLIIMTTWQSKQIIKEASKLETAAHAARTLCQSRVITLTEEERKSKKQINRINSSEERKACWYCLTQDHPVSFHCQLLFPTFSSCSALLSLDQLLAWLKPEAPTSLALKTQCEKHIQHHNLHFASLRCVSSASPRPHEMLLLQISTHVSCSASCCRRRSAAAAALTVTQHALSLLQRKPVIYSLLYIHSSRRNTGEYSWDGALPHWRNLCTTACLSLPSSLALSHILGLGIT